MNNTALRAKTQLRCVVPSTNNTHMVFADEQHEKFYYEKLEQARYQDCLVTIAALFSAGSSRRGWTDRVG